MSLSLWLCESIYKIKVLIYSIIAENRICLIDFDDLEIY